MKKDKNDNLIPFKKGYDPRRNYDGRPKILPELKEAIENVFNEDGKTIELVLQKLLNKALKGDLQAIKEILDRYYGKTPQSINLKNNIKIQKPLIINVDGKELEL